MRLLLKTLHEVTAAGGDRAFVERIIYLLAVFPRIYDARIF